MTTSNYTTLLGLALPTTGDLSGQWGNEVNDYISKYVDSSVAGTQTISGSQTAVTLSRANGVPLSQAGSSSTGSSQYQVINCTGNPAGTLTVTIDVTTGSPALSNSTYSQTFAVINGTSTSQSVVVRATTTSGTSTGVTLVSGEKALIAWNGSDFIKVATSTVDGVSTIAFGTTGLTPSSATSGAVTVAGTLVAANGGTGQSSYTTGDLLYATGSTALSKLGIGTNGQILTSTGTAPQWSTLSGVAVTTFSAGTTGFTPSSATSGAITLAGTLATTNGGTGLTSFTANGVVYASSSSALTTGSALSFNGTVLQNDQSSASSGLLFNLQNTSTGSYMQFAMPGVANVRFGAPNADAFVWQTFGSGTYPEAMRLTSTGLGIGTSSPAYKLHIVNDTSATNTAVDVLALTQSSTGTAASGLGAGILFNSERPSSGVILRRGAIYGVSGADPDDDGALAFYTLSDTGASGFNEKMRLDSSGNLGLGVTPSAWNANNKSIIQLQNTANLFTRSTGLLATSNVVYNSADTGVFQANGYGLMYQQNQTAGTHVWLNTPNNTSGAGATASLTSAMTLSSAANLLVGTTANNYSASIIAADAITTIWSGTIGLRYNVSGQTTAYYKGMTGTSIENGTARGLHIFNYDQDSNPGILFYPNNYAGQTANPAVTITPAGNVGIGTTSPGARLNAVVSYVASTIVPSLKLSTVGGYSTDSGTAIDFGQDQGTYSTWVTGRVASPRTGSNWGGSLTFLTNDDSSATALVERARITSGGYFKASNNGTYNGGSTSQTHEFNQSVDNNALIVYGTNATLSTAGLVFLQAARNTTNNSFYALSYYNSGAGAYKFRVADSGDVTNTNGTYGTISDAKMKTDIVDAGSQWADIKAIRFRKFKMKDDPSGLVQLGVVAQELEQTSPGLVAEHKDVDGEGVDLGTTTKSVKTSVLLMKAAVALQEAMARIEQLEAKVAALEAK